MSLWDYSLITVADAKNWLDVALEDEDRDGLIETLIQEASEGIEEYCGRRFVSRGAITEYHTFDNSDHELETLQSPIISMTTIHEDSTRAYASTELLTENTDYVVVKPKGKVVRINGATGGRRNWGGGFYAIKVIYTGGYSTIADVPGPLKDVCRRLVGIKYREIERKQQGISGASDDFGNYTRFGASDITDRMKQQLNPWKLFPEYATGEVLV